MKKIIILFVLSFFFVGEAAASCGGGSCSFQCDQTFEGKLRYGHQYTFYDDFTNNTNNVIGINNLEVNYLEQYDYNGSSNFPGFVWTSWFKSKEYKLNPLDSGAVKKATSNYPINYHPVTRSRNNLVLQYKAKYYEKEGDTWNRTAKYHTECKYYEVTWCGDGVVDYDYNEQCDPNDTNHKGWGNGGCNASCEPVNNPPTPTCDSLGVNPTSGHAPLDSSIYCNGTNASSYKIDIKKDGDLIKTINGNSGDYTFTNAGDYNVTCYVNGNVTSSACSKNVEVKPVCQPTCGNGDLETGEQCDDGNLYNGDGCSSTCELEPNPVCGNGLIETGEQCDDGNRSNGDGCSSICKPEPYCGDGNLDSGEQCDDNNTTNGDGCSATCTIEPEPACGDGNLDSGEQCDDGNTTNGDGCSSVCTIEPICGDGNIDTGETCDDGNTSNGDGCSSVCIIEPICGDGILQSGEVCDDGNTVNGDGCSSVCRVETPKIYDLAITKEVTSSGSTFKVGDAVIYKVIVENQGEIDAKNVEVIDYIPEHMEVVSGNDWIVLGNKAKQTISIVPVGQKRELVLTLNILDGANGTMINYAEIFNSVNDQGIKDCDSEEENDENNNHADNQGGDFTNANDNPNGCFADDGDEDDTDPASITVTASVFDLAITKEVTSSATKYKVGDIVEYKIAVENQGNIDATDVEVIDYVPANMELVSGNGWSTVVSGETKQTLPFLLAGTGRELTIKLKILSGATGTVTNYAEIFDAEGGTDCDSTPESEENNNHADDQDGDYTDANGNPSGCNSDDGDEDDTDPASITITGPVCGNGVIETGEACDDGNTTNGDGCNSVCRTEGGHSRTATCLDIETSGSRVTCTGNNKVGTFKVDCGNGENKYVSAIKNSDNTITNASVTCDYSTNAKTSSARCYVSQMGINVIPTPRDNYRGFSTRNQCGDTTGSERCGNGVLEGNEECEKDSNGVFPSVCNTNCTIKTGGGGGVITVPGEVPGIITIPNHGKIIFGERANVIIYKGQKVSDKVATPYIENQSDYDLSFKSICIVKTSGNTLTLPTTQPNCKALPSILYPGQKVEFLGAYDQYKGKKIITGNYGDNELKITYQKHDGTILDWAYFAETVKVRVSKPSIVTTGGGTSYIRDTRKVADINKVAIIDADKNKNFVGTSVSDITSYSDNTNNISVIGEVEDQGDDYSDNLSDVSNVTTVVATDVTLSDKKLYNGMKNVYIFKNKNLKIDNANSLNSFTGPVTFIVENGNLVINKDIEYSDNVAFVVKGGNIVIKDTVKRIDGTYIALKKGAGGNIESIESTETLVVNGSLYGNIEKLVENRVKVEENNGNLSVGTVVSFGSALFRKPAPLVSQFITEYVNQAKVAQ